MPVRKRKTSLVAEEEPASRRRSLRLSSSDQKSKYFEAESDTDTSAVIGNNESKRHRGRGRPPKKAKVKEAEPEGEDEDEDEYKDETQQSGANPPESEDEFDEDAPPKVTFIPRPKLRDTGGVEYADDRLHENTLAFLRDLKANNKRSWLKGSLFSSSPRPAEPQLNQTCSPRRGIPPRPQGLGDVRHDAHRQDHRGRPDHPGAALQGRQLPHLSRHPLQQRPHAVQGTTHSRLLPLKTSPTPIPSQSKPPH